MEDKLVGAGKQWLAGPAIGVRTPQAAAANAINPLRPMQAAR
ncbi:MAG TPA: hypothetical protein VK801_03035 [Caulobacteraceae bacterium]|nr:hypothetical protein [Caulobacteraceae bacterium]